MKLFKSVDIVISICYYNIKTIERWMKYESSKNKY